MAKFFSGMSKDAFLDGLVSITGLNGHELYEYLEELSNKYPKEKKERSISEIVPQNKLKPGIEFCGTYSELQDYATLAGVSEKMVRWIGSSTPAFAAYIVAAELGLKWFMWEKPSKNPGALTCNIGMYNPASRKWDIMTECNKEDWIKNRENFLNEKSLFT